MLPSSHPDFEYFSNHTHMALIYPMRHRWGGQGVTAKAKKLMKRQDPRGPAFIRMKALYKEGLHNYAKRRAHEQNQ